MKNEQPLGSILKDWLKDDRIKRKLMEAKIITGWSAICGEFIANYTNKLSLNGRILIIHVTSAPLRNELVMGKPILLSNINEYLGETYVEDVQIF